MKFGSIRRRAVAHTRFLVNDLLCRPMRRWPTETIFARLGAVKGNWPDQDGSGPQVFAVCCRHYFAEYAEALLTSIAGTSPGCGAHLHLYDPGEREFEDLESLRMRLPALRLTYTWENPDLSGFDRFQRATYYGSVRFLRFYAALRHSRRPMLSLDIDSVVRAPLAPMFREAGNADLGLFLRPHIMDPGRKLLAGAVYGAPTPAGLAFFETVARRIGIQLISKRFVRMLDQRCLWLAYLRHRDRLNFWPIPATYLDIAFRPESVIWTFRGSDKEGELYRRERERLRRHRPEPPPSRPNAP